MGTHGDTLSLTGDNCNHWPVSCCPGCPCKASLSTFSLMDSWGAGTLRLWRVCSSPASRCLHLLQSFAASAVAMVAVRWRCSVSSTPMFIRYCSSRKYLLVKLWYQCRHMDSLFFKYCYHSIPSYSFLCIQWPHWVCGSKKADVAL